MELTQRLNVKGANIVHDIIDGEVVIINLDNGNYYSLDGAGADIWQGITEGCSLREITGRLLSHYAGDPQTIEAAVRGLAAELEMEALVVVSEAPSTLPSQRTPPDVKTAERRSAFHAPTLSRYVDMQDLLLLDPIHDVDEAGWPHAKSESGDA